MKQWITRRGYRNGSHSTSAAAFVQNCRLALESWVNVLNNAFTSSIAIGLRLIANHRSRPTYSYCAVHSKTRFRRHLRSRHWPKIGLFPLALPQAAPKTNRARPRVRRRLFGSNLNLPRASMQATP
jgi:hypothetical protein